MEACAVTTGGFQEGVGADDVGVQEGEGSCSELSLWDSAA